MEVAIIRWPDEASRRDHVLASGQPVLLVVESGPPPSVTQALEDWIRVPATDADLEARLETLRHRHAALEPAPASPVLEEGGILRFGTSWVSLSPLEARLVTVLIQRFGAVVTRQVLTQAGWPPVDGEPASPHRNVLDAHILRLRHRLPTIGLTIRTVRSRGYLIEPLAPDSTP